MKQSMLVNPVDSTINLDTTAEEMEVLDLDQDLTVEEPVAMEEDTDHSNPPDPGQRQQEGQEQPLRGHHQKLPTHIS